MDGSCVTIGSMKRDAVFNVRLPADVKAAVQRAAEDDHGRSASNMVVKVLSEWLTAKGYLTEAGKLPARNRKGH